MVPRCIEPAKVPIDAEFSAVPSKSWTHRALIAAALGHGVSRIEGPLDADDTRHTRQGLEALGVGVTDDAGAWVVAGTGGAIEGGVAIPCGASGTTARFLAAVAALAVRRSRIDGNERLRQRPMGELLDALRGIGAHVECRDGRLPVTVGGGLSGGTIAISGERSSQFASALLLVGSALARGLDLEVLPPRASFGYALLTVDVLARFGVAVNRRGEGRFRGIEPQKRGGHAVAVEGDHSAASYLFAAAAITGGRVRVRGLESTSVQPDARFTRDLAGLGCEVIDDRGGLVVTAREPLRAFDWTLDDAPDLAPTAAVLALFARGTSRLRGLANLRIKESDRLSVLAANASRLGATVTIDSDALVIRPPRSGLRGGVVETAGDHRIAMAFAIAGLRIAGISVDDPSVVPESYPAFWSDVSKLSSGS